MRGRVMLLKGYGNAVNVQLAKTFVQAAIDALKVIH
jgi:hypothetical protein